MDCGAVFVKLDQQALHRLYLPKHQPGGLLTRYCLSAPQADLGSWDKTCLLEARVDASRRPGCMGTGTAGLELLVTCLQRAP